MFFKKVDDSYNFKTLYKTLEKAYLTYDKLVIAYDLDDTVRLFKSKSCKETIKTIKRCHKILDPWFIVYTASTNIEFNKYTLNEELDLPWHSINEYPKNLYFGELQDKQAIANQNGIPTKLYYNILLDDKSFGLKWACKALNKLCDKVEKGKI